MSLSRRKPDLDRWSPGFGHASTTSSTGSCRSSTELVGAGLDPLLPRKQDLQAAQAPVRTPMPENVYGSRTAELDAVQSQYRIRSNTRQAGLPGAHGRLVPLLPGRRGGELLDQRRVARQEGHDEAGHAIFPGAGQDLQQGLLEAAFRRRRTGNSTIYCHRLEQPQATKRFKERLLRS